LLKEFFGVTMKLEVVAEFGGGDFEGTGLATSGLACGALPPSLLIEGAG
jgi:hypothetical protein